MRQQKYYEAYLDDYDKIMVYMSKDSYDGKSNVFYLKNTAGEITKLHIQSMNAMQSKYIIYTLGFDVPIRIGEEYYVGHQHARTTVLQYAGIVKTNRFDEEFYYEGTDLGFTYTPGQTSFALWAPSAYRIKLEIKKEGEVSTYEMRRTDQGVFRYTILDDLEHATYVYLIRVNGEWNESIDPYGTSSIENTKRSAIVDMKKITNKWYPLPKMTSYCDAIIYEASVRDFTMQEDIGVQHPGTYAGFVEKNEKTKKACTGFHYLKSLGITHVQLLPVLDFGSVDEKNPMLYYNWGYDPLQYKSLEGSYSTNASDPYARMIEFSKLVEECHKHEIRVNLDVVFNHVYDMQQSSFHKVVPNYYFQMNENGEFSNGSYCGNDIDSTRKMCRKYIVDTCEFLVKTYQVDGFRFDLMGILDVDTMNEVFLRCFCIKSDIMIYGEGWDMPSFLAQDKRASIRNNAQMPNVAHFSDRFRDVVKGRTSTNEVGVKGYGTGALYLMDMMKNCLSASCTSQGMDRLFMQPINVVNYVECHDNMTSWDKIQLCCEEDREEVCIARHKMLIAMTLVAQGIPFLHSGQEFARTKHGLANTYEASDHINRIDYSRRDQYQDIVNSTKDLIQIRKEHPAFRYKTREDIARYVSFEDIERSVLLYKSKNENEEVIVLFNPTSETFHYECKEVYTLLYYNKKVDNINLKTVTIEPYCTIILTNKGILV